MATLAVPRMREDNRSLPTIIKPEETRMQSKAEIDGILSKTSDAKEIPGVVAIAASGNEVLYQGAFGKRDLSKPDAMTADSVFWIASMTKAVTGAGAMQLVEQGKLSLDAPIGSLLPDLAKPQVLEGFDAKGEPKLRPAKSAITLRQLMTHTAGFAYNMWNGDLAVYLEKTGIPAITTCQNAALKTPVMTDPGTRWEYGTNIDFVGKAVEAVLSARQSVRAARHVRHRLQDHRRHAQAPGRHAFPRRGRPARRDPVRARAEPRIPHGWRRPLFDRG
jgi:CubicO group peptidase (beta-lactamase class C family)